VIGARRQVELAHGRLHQRAAGVIQRAELAHFGGRMSALQVSDGGRPSVPRAKRRRWRWRGGFDAPLDGRRRLTQAGVAEFLVCDARHFDVDVDAVEQRAGDALLVARDVVLSRYRV